MKISQKYLRPTSSPTSRPAAGARARARLRRPPTSTRSDGVADDGRSRVGAARDAGRAVGGGGRRVRRARRLSRVDFVRHVRRVRARSRRARGTRPRVVRGTGGTVCSAGRTARFARGESTVRNRRCMTVQNRRGRRGWRSRGRRAWGWTRERFSRLKDEERWRASSRATPTEDCGSSRRREVRVATEMIRRPERPERPEP